MVGSRRAKLNKGDASATDIKQVDPSAFTYLLINALQEQSKLIKAQDARIAALEQRQPSVMSSSASPGGLAAAMALIFLPLAVMAQRRKRARPSHR
jgi:hypothetical protein